MAADNGGDIGAVTAFQPVESVGGDYAKRDLAVVFDFVSFFFFGSAS